VRDTARGTEDQGLGDRCAHDAARRLRGEPEAAQARRGGVRLGLDHRRHGQGEGAWASVRAPCLHVRDGRLRTPRRALREPLTDDRNPRAVFAVLGMLGLLYCLICVDLLGASDATSISSIVSPSLGHQTSNVLLSMSSFNPLSPRLELMVWVNFQMPSSLRCTYWNWVSRQFCL
jgi:hypothetical protein